MNVPALISARERRPDPYGGDVVVARSIARVHRRNPWTGRCRACKDRYPCRDSQDARAVLGGLGSARQPSGRLGLLVVTAVPVVLGLLVIAASVVGVARCP